VAREKALTEYSKHLIREWQRSGKTLVDLEIAAGSKSSGHFSQILSGKLGASQRMAEYLAKAHHKTPTQIRIEADEWYAANAKNVEKLDHEDPEIAKAIEATRKVAETFGHPMPEHSVRRALLRWKDVRDQTSEWWFQKFAEEERLEVVDHCGAVVDHRKQKRVTAGKRRAIRELGEQKRNPPAVSRSPRRARGA